MTRKPMIGIPADRRLLGQHYFHCVGEKYLAAIVEAADAVPVMIPSLGAGQYLEQLVTQLDGMLLSGSPSNIEPPRYGGEAADHIGVADAQRDATMLPLIPRLVAAGMPVLAICRGFQEMNVAYGGTLWTKVHEVPGLHDHREDESLPLDEQYGPAHEVRLTEGGELRRIAGSDRLQVNSLHWQGVRTLGTGLTVEATAPDGLIEAFRVTQAPAFALAMQWHPEWKAMSNPFSRALFAKFGQAARAFAARSFRS